MPNEFNHLSHVVLHAAQRRLLKLTFAVSDVIRGIIAEDAEMMFRQIIGKGGIIQRSLSVSGGDDDGGKIGIVQLNEMVVCDRNRLASCISTFTRHADDGY